MLHDPLIDSHAHTDAFSPTDWSHVVKRALQCGVQGNISSGVWWDQFESLILNFRPWTVSRVPTTQAFHELIAMKDAYRVLPCLGLHPMEVGRRWRTLKGTFCRDSALADIADFRRVALNHRDHLWAIGETGFDAAEDVKQGWLDKNELLTAQRFAFDACVELAKESNLPVVIHSRAAWQFTLQCIEDSKIIGSTRFMIHCYGGPVDGLKWIEAQGGFASFGGVMTWPHARKVQNALKVCPASVLLFETDAPDLPPELQDGLRPARNEPGYLPYILQRAALIREQHVDELIRLNYRNLTRFLFGALPDSNG